VPQAAFKLPKVNPLVIYAQLEHGLKAMPLLVQPVLLGNSNLSLDKLVASIARWVITLL